MKVNVSVLSFWLHTNRILYIVLPTSRTLCLFTTPLQYSPLSLKLPDQHIMAHHFRHRQQKERNLRARSSSAFIPDPSDRTEDIAAPDRPRRKIHGNHPLAAGCLSWEEALQNYSENELFWAELSNNSVNQSRDQAPSSEPPRNPRKVSLFKYVPF